MKQSQSPDSLNRLVRQTVSAFRKRAATWEANEGELGKIVASELRGVIDSFEALHHRWPNSDAPHQRPASLTSRVTRSVVAGSLHLLITYQAPNGSSINLTPKQIEVLEKAHKWPTNNRGEEYCTVSHGLHVGTPDCDTTLLSDLLENFEAKDRPGQVLQWVNHEWDSENPACVRCGETMCLNDGCEWDDDPALNLCHTCALSVIRDLSIKP